MSDDMDLGAEISAAMSGSTSTAEPSSTSASPEATSAASTGTDTTVPAQATPVVSPASTDTTTKQGPIPFDVHSKALDNARQKATAEWERDYGWARQVKREEFQQAVEFARRVSTDPIAHVTDLIAELQAHPQHSQTLKSLAARALSAGRAGTTTTMPDPDVQITDAHGNVIGTTYSAEAQHRREALLVQQAVEAVRKEMAPVVKTHETLAAKQQKELDEAEGKKFASELMGELSDRPGFKENLQEVGAEVLRMVQQYPENDPRPNHPDFLRYAAERAYNRVVVPKLNTSARTSVLADLTTKSQANTVSPSAHANAAPKSYADLSWGEAFQAELAARR